MSLSWKDKQNGVDIIDAKDINNIAHSIIDLENKEFPTKLSQLEADVNDIKVNIGSIDTALDEIMHIQNQLISGVLV